MDEREAEESRRRKEEARFFHERKLSPTRTETHFIRNSPVKVIHGWLPKEQDNGFVATAKYEATYDISPFSVPALVDADTETGLSEPLEGLISRMGGKKMLKAWLVSMFPRDVKTYVEPFGGSFQVFLARPWRNRIEIINDIDEDLITFYRYAVFDPEGLCDYINRLPTHEGMILGLRKALVGGDLEGIQRAAAFYVIARSAFNAMVSDHVSRYSSSPHVLVKTSISRREIMAVAKRLQGVDIRCTSYDRLLRQAVKKVDGGAFYYLDPPYDQTEGYTGLGSKDEHGFGWADQVKLSEFCVQIDKLGNKFIQTNSATDRLKELYGGYKRPDGSPRFYIITKDVYYSVSGTAKNRGDVQEFIISNYDLIEGQAKKQRSLF